MMRKRTNAIDLQDREMQMAIVKSEFKRVQAFIVALFIGSMLMIFNFFILKGNTDFFTRGSSKYVVVAWFVLFLCFELINYLLIRRSLKQKILMPHWIKYATITIESLLPGLLILILSVREGSVWFLDSPLMLFYFVLITLAALNLETKLAMMMGVISAVSYFSITYWTIARYDPDHTILYLPPVLYYARSFFLMLTALASSFVTMEIKMRYRHIFQIQQQKNQMELIFGQQVSQAVANTLLSNNAYSSRDEVTIMFLDIRGYSHIIEHMDPEEVIQFQNNFFNPIINIVKHNGGIVNQILGDGLMATFGSPMKMKNHADVAYITGINILGNLKHTIERGKLPEMRIGIGLDSGEVVVGNIGNDSRKQFSISGTTVVTAARVEQANKLYNTQFLISRNTLEKMIQQPINVKFIGEIALKNMTHGLDVFKVN